ncbi:MAG: hypothetical protein KF773_41910 [Deltaproteobacteria bacterium]|nr:hypothetical protein [Deltaproteobacteria bacterium]
MIDVFEPAPLQRMPPPAAAANDFARDVQRHEHVGLALYAARAGPGRATAATAPATQNHHTNKLTM